MATQYRQARLFTQPAELPCGCRPGSYDCPEAMALWQRCTDIYNEAKRTQNWAAYDREYPIARAAYRTHQGLPTNA